MFFKDLVNFFTKNRQIFFQRTDRMLFLVLVSRQSSLERNILVEEIGKSLRNDGDRSRTIFVILNLDQVLVLGAAAVAQYAHLVFVVVVFVQL
jgi:hypothetical protein